MTTPVSLVPVAVPAVAPVAAAPDDVFASVLAALSGALGLPVQAAPFVTGEIVTYSSGGGAAIGGGEWLMGPAVTARYGGAIMWLATLSILGQVVYNLEISRYTLYTGEPIFTGTSTVLCDVTTGDA